MQRVKKFLRYSNISEIIGFPLCIRLLFMWQLAFAIVIGPQLELREIFPFFRWNLFDKVNKIRFVPIILITKVNNHEFAKPQNYYDFFSQKNPHVDIVTAHDLLNKMQREKNIEIKNKTRATIESHLFKGFSFIEYNISIVKIDSYQYFLSREIIEVERVDGPYSYGKTP